MVIEMPGKAGSTFMTWSALRGRLPVGPKTE